MPPENVRYPPSRRARNYIKNTLAKCSNPPQKATEIKENIARKNGYKRFYLTTELGLYKGSWKNNLRHGMGTQINNTTLETYEGEFYEDKPSGNGVLSRMKPNRKQELIYQGEFVNGVPNGSGGLFTDTYHFKGNVINGKASGTGIAWFNNGTIYIGSWFNGKRTGQGMQIDNNKNRYEGNWYEDKKHGYGYYYCFDRGQALEGIWVADFCIRGIMRNTKYRQAASHPLKYAIPKLMLKDWTSCYYLWHQDAWASVGKYVREDVGIKDLKKQEMSSLQATLYDMKQDREDEINEDADEINLLHPNIHSEFPTSITEIQPCVTFR